MVAKRQGASRRIKKDEQRESVPGASFEGFNFKEALQLFKKVKDLIDDAHKNDGKIDTQEALGILQELFVDLEKTQNKRVKGKVLQIKTKYLDLVARIRSVPFLFTFLEKEYPQFFTLFSETTPKVTASNSVSGSKPSPEPVSGPASVSDPATVAASSEGPSSARETASDSLKDEGRDGVEKGRDPVASDDDDGLGGGRENDKDAFDDDIGPELSVEQKEQIRARIAVLLESISARDFWRDDVDVSEDQALLFDFFSDAERRNYVRRQLFLNGQTEAVFFDRLVAQARNEGEARRILREILGEVSGLTPSVRREIFAAEVVERRTPEEGPRREGSASEAPPSSSKNRISGDVLEEEKTVGALMPLPLSRPEPGPVPTDDGDSAGSRTERTSAPEGFFTRARNWVRSYATAADETLSAYDSYRSHIRGEVTRQEQYGISPTLSRGAMLAGGVLSGALSYFGVSLPFDAVRYATQRHFTGVEREEIAEAFRVALVERQRREPEARGEDVRERHSALRRRVEASRYLTDLQKAELLRRLEDQEDTFAAQEAPHSEHLQREVGRILEDAIRTRVTGEKVAKELVNSSFALMGGPLAVAGANFLRAPAYGAISVYSRWHRLTRENPESVASERLRATITGGFHEWWDKFSGNKGRLAQAAAVGTLFRFVGMSATLAEAAFQSEALSGLFGAWEHHEAAFPQDAHGISEQSLADAEQRVLEHASNAHDVVSDAHHYAGALDQHSDVLDHDDVDAVHGGVSESVDGVDETVDPGEYVDVVLSPEQIPSEALVRHGDGVTQSLLSAVEAHPNLLNDVDRVALRDDYAAALLMRRLAARDGLLDYWLSDKAIGNVAIVPQYDGAEAHIAFLNPDTGTAYSLDELKTLGWLIKAPKKAA